METVTTFITSVGFPVAMCVAMFQYIKTLTDKHEDEISGLKDTLHENTKVLTELTTLIKTLSQYGSKE